MSERTGIKYSGRLFGRAGSTYFPLTESTEDVDRLHDRTAELETEIRTAETVVHTLELEVAELEAENKRLRNLEMVAKRFLHYWKWNYPGNLQGEKVDDYAALMRRFVAYNPLREAAEPAQNSPELPQPDITQDMTPFPEGPR
jgi:hypothetical protein